MTGEDAFDAKMMFRTLLMPFRRITIAVDGLHVNDLTKVLRRAVSFLEEQGIRIGYRKAFYTPATLSDYWETLHLHHRASGDGSILIGISGVHDHWTCVERVSPATMHLADSGIMTKIDRAKATVGRPTARRPHQLHADQTFLLYRR